MRFIFSQNLRTILALAEEQSLKFLFKVVNITAASAAPLPKCILPHAYSLCSSQLHELKQKLLIAYVTSWHNNILCYK